MSALDSDIVIPRQEGMTRHVTLNFDPDYLAQLPELRRNFLVSLEVALKAQGLTTVSTYEAHLPLPPTDKLHQGIIFIKSLSDLFVRPSDVDEIRILSLDEFERKKLFTSEQLETIRTEGIFRVKSRKYRDQYHVWRLHEILPEGSLNTKKKFEKTLCSSLEHLLVAIPNNFSKKNASKDALTVQWGCEILYLGFRQLLNSTIGLIDRNPVNGAKEIPGNSAELSVEMEPVRVYFTLYKWISSDWSTDREHDYMSVHSDHVFWRWNVLGHRILQLMNNGLFGVLVLNLWNGVIGLRAMNLVASTFRAGVVNDCSTYAGNLRGAVTRFNDALDRFQYAPDNRMIAKRFLRPFFVTVQLVLCATQLVFIAVGQPALTACNITISILIVLTAPLWATLMSFLALLVTMLLVDFDYDIYTYNLEKRRNPIFTVPAQLMDMVICGVGQIVLKIVQTVAYDIPMFIIKGIYAYVRFFCRRVWDNLTMLVLSRRMHVPSMDTYFVKRIQGPCLSTSDTYSFQVEPEVAYSALQTTLEKEVLDLYVKKETAAIKKPLKDFNDFFVNYFDPLHVDASRLPEAIQLKTEEKASLKALDDATRERYEVLLKASLRDMQNARNADALNMAKITLSAENIHTTFKESECIVKMYYEERIASYIDTNETLTYWGERNVPINDFNRLMTYFYKRTFHAEFLTPFKGDDGNKTCIVKVVHPSLIVNNSPFPYARDEIPEHQPV